MHVSMNYYLPLRRSPEQQQKNAEYVEAAINHV